MSCHHPAEFRDSLGGRDYHCRHCGKDVLAHRSCHHPLPLRTPLEHNKTAFHCAHCDRDIYPHASRRVRHGTNNGYEKHRRMRSGDWSWPPCPPCAEGRRAYQRELNAGEGPPRQAKRLRSAARLAAYHRLSQVYPREFAKYYAEELSIRRDGGVVVLGGLRSELKTILASGVSEGHLIRAVRARTATVAELQLYDRISYLRRRISEVEQSVKAREPAGDS